MRLSVSSWLLVGSLLLSLSHVRSDSAEIANLQDDQSERELLVHRVQNLKAREQIRVNRTEKRDTRKAVVAEEERLKQQAITVRAEEGGQAEKADKKKARLKKAKLAKKQQNQDVLAAESRAVGGQGKQKKEKEQAVGAGDKQKKNKNENEKARNQKNGLGRKQDGKARAKKVEGKKNKKEKKKNRRLLEADEDLQLEAERELVESRELKNKQNKEARANIREKRAQKRDQRKASLAELQQAQSIAVDRAGDAGTNKKKKNKNKNKKAAAIQNIQRAENNNNGNKKKKIVQTQKNGAQKKKNGKKNGKARNQKNGQAEKRNGNDGNGKQKQKQKNQEKARAKAMEADKAVDPTVKKMRDQIAKAEAKKEKKGKNKRFLADENEDEAEAEAEAEPEKQGERALNQRKKNLRARQNHEALVEDRKAHTEARAEAAEKFQRAEKNKKRKEARGGKEQRKGKNKNINRAKKDEEASPEEEVNSPNRAYQMPRALPRRIATLFWGVFNNPEACPQQPCLLQDALLNETQASILHGSGSILSENGDVVLVSTIYRTAETLDVSGDAILDVIHELTDGNMSSAGVNDTDAQIVIGIRSAAAVEGGSEMAQLLQMSEFLDGRLDDFVQFAVFEAGASGFRKAYDWYSEMTIISSVVHLNRQHDALQIYFETNLNALPESPES